MSIIDDLLILVEDSKKITLDIVCRKMKGYRRQTISSGLGRLSAKDLINKQNIDKQNCFIISKNGREIIDRELDNIKYINQKNYPLNWFIVIFNIPEKLRKYRDELRRQLINHGFGRLHDSVWFSKQNQKQSIQKIINDFNLSSNVVFLETKEFNRDENKKMIEKLNWNWKDINKKYKIFISNVNRYLDFKNKETYRAKQLVYELAKIIKSDPKLPDYLYNKDYKKEKAIKLYKKIRPYCY